MKLTPKDYVESKPELAKAGFKAIKDLLADNTDGKKSPDDIAILFGIELKVIELVATTGSYADYQMVVDLELEKEKTVKELEAERNKKVTPQLTRWQWTWGTAVFLALVGGLIWLIIWIVGRLT